MGRKVFLSFLGLGSYNKETKKYFYNKTNYELNGNNYLSEFVQISEISLLEKDFDKIIILSTKTSSQSHFSNLKSQLVNLGVDLDKLLEVEITENMDAKSQWSWFENILSIIDFEDEITFDLTHGFRVMPIVLSTAINFLKKIKNIDISAVYYGAYQYGQAITPIIDMKEFYIINEWTDAVSRLVEDADARKLAEVSQREGNLQLPELNNKELIKAFEDLTNSIRNVEVQRIGEKAGDALRIIEKYKENASTTSKLMLNAVWEKFVGISISTDKYNKDYFLLQLEIIKLLLEHKLYMQAFTVMREMIGSVGMLIKKDDVKTTNKKGRLKRTYADIFISMLRIEERKWKFNGDKENQKNNLLDLYRKIEEIKALNLIRSLLKELVKYRNGFDHAWTSRSMFDDIDNKGNKFLDKLKKFINLLIENNILI